MLSPGMCVIPRRFAMKMVAANDSPMTAPTFRMNELTSFLSDIIIVFELQI